MNSDSQDLQSSLWSGAHRGCLAGAAGDAGASAAAHKADSVDGSFAPQTGLRPKSI